MTITLISGGNKGLGREAGRRLIGLGHTVYLGARDAVRGQAAADELGARFLLLDVTDDASVAVAAAGLTCLRVVQGPDGPTGTLVSRTGPTPW